MIVNKVYQIFTSPDFFVSRLKITSGRWPDTMTGQRNFCSVKLLLSPVKILEKYVAKPLCNFLIAFLQRDKNLSFTGEDLAGCSKMSVRRDPSTWPASDVSGRSRPHSGRTFSVHRPLFRALGFVSLLWLTDCKQNCFKRFLMWFARLSFFPSNMK